MHMLVEVRFELPQFLVQRLITCAYISWSCVFQTGFANLLHQFSRNVMIFHHGVNWVPHRLEEGRLDRAISRFGSFQCVDVRKQNLFLLLHMHDHLSRDFGEETPDIRNFGVTFSMLCFYFIQRG